MRAEIEARAAIHAVDIYGLSEIMGPGVASECVETTDGLHVREDHFYPEIVHESSGAVLEPGKRGELVFTTLTKEALPLIRYRTRDLTRLLPGTARPMRRIERVTGRSDDMIILRGVNLFPDADRRADPARARPCSPLSARAVATAAPGRAHGPRRSANRCGRRRPPARERRAARVARSRIRSASP